MNCLLATHPLLKTEILIKHNVNIGDYNIVTHFLKNASKDYEPKKAKVFKNEDVQNFISNAPDQIYLVMKVSILFETFLTYIARKLKLIFFIYLFIFLGSSYIWYLRSLPRKRANRPERRTRPRS